MTGQSGDVQREDAAATERGGASLAGLRDAVAEALWDTGLGGCDDPDCDDEYHGTLCKGSRWVIQQATNAALDAVPDGWAKVDGEWFQIADDGSGYGEFDRVEATDG